jgi:hypothetical protein
MAEITRKVLDEATSVKIWSSVIMVFSRLLGARWSNATGGSGK